jgi:hypothetical protein
MEYWNNIAAQFGGKVANIATGSATPGNDLISLRNRGLITSDVANKAAKVICRQPLEDAAKAETAFERYYDI